MGMQMTNTDIEDIIRDIGKSIRDARKEKKISAADLANSVGLGRMTIMRIESGDPGVSLASVLKVASALALDLNMKQMLSPERVLLKMVQLKMDRADHIPQSHLEEAASPGI